MKGREDVRYHRGLNGGSTCLHGMPWHGEATRPVSRKFWPLLLYWRGPFISVVGTQKNMENEEKGRGGGQAEIKKGAGSKEKGWASSWWGRSS